MLVFRPAVERDAELLTALALRSKAYWGYSPAFMESCREELTVSPADIRDEVIEFVLAEGPAGVAGFYGIEHRGGEDCELEALFVEPGLIGTGVGRALIRHALRHAAKLGAQRLIVQGDPHARRFYRAAGGIPAGSLESYSIPGRLLPVFVIPVPDTAADGVR